MSDDDVVRKAVHKLREKELEIKKKLNVEDAYSFWDADNDLLAWKNSGKDKIEEVFGRLCRFTGSEAEAIGEEIDYTFLFEDKVLLQFMKSWEEVRSVFDVRQIFGCAKVERVAADGRDGLLQYCEEMNDVLVRYVGFLKGKGIRDILHKTEVHTGKRDRLGKRVCYMRTVIDLYRSNQELWRPEMVKLGLLKDKV